MTTLKKSEFDIQKDAIAASINAIFATADTQKRPLNADELQQVKALESAVDALGSKPQPRKSTPDQPGSNFSELYPPQHADVSPRGRKCTQLFNVRSTSNDGFKSIGDFASAVHFNSERLAAAAGQQKGIPSDGGFSVPESLAFEVLDGALELEIVRPRCRVVGMETETRTVWTFDDSSHADGELFGGLAGVWMAEADELSLKTSKLRQIKLTAKKLGFLCAASNELLTDAPGYETEFTARMSQTIGWNLDRTFLISGTGSGQPLSVLNDGATITVDKESGQSAATIEYANLVKMFARLHPGSLGNSVWICTSTAIPQLLQMTISVGTGGSFIPLMTETAGQFRILTRPVVFTEKLNTLGTLGDIMLVDLSQYVVGVMREGLRMDKSGHVYFTTDQSAFRVILRTDGRGVWKSAFTPVNGSSLSWAVTLAARS